MADTGSTQFPNTSRIDNNAGNKGAGAKTILSASLLGAPNANKGAEDKIQHLRGTVINQNDKGQVRIQTEKGIVEVQLPKDSKGRDVPLRQGQKVELEIPPEKVRTRNPDTVRIKTDAPPAQDQSGRPRSDTAQTSPKSQESAPVKGQSQASSGVQQSESVAPKQADAKANIQVQKPSLANMPAPEVRVEGVKQQNTIALSKLVGETIRLDPLPPQLSAQMIAPEIQILPQAISPQALEVLSQSVQQNIDTEQLQNLLMAAPAKGEVPPSIIQTENSSISEQSNFIINQLISGEIKPLTFTSVIPPETASAPMVTGSGNTIPFTKIAPKPIDLINFFAASKITTSALDNAPIIKEPFSKIPAGENLTALINDIKTPPLQLVPPETAQKIDALPVPDIPEKIDIKTLILEGRQPATLTAEVIGKTASSLPVISVIPDQGALPQNFILQVPVHDVIAGSTIELTPQSAPLNASAITTGVLQMPLPAPAYFLMPGQWPLMEDILQSVQQTSAQAAQVFSASIPNAAQPAQLTPAALFFIAALRAGDLSSILGERTQQILRAQGKGGLISRLGQEGSIINRTEQTPSSEWRSLTLPMAWENDIQKVALHYKHDYPDSEDNNKGEKQTRFIFDLSLTRMGKVQLDGLHRENRLNIIIRTETNISQAMQATMKQAYHESLASTELSGDLSFQGNLDGWVKINAAQDDHYIDQI